MTQIKHFKHCKSIDEVKSEYKRLAQQWLPTENSAGEVNLMRCADEEYYEISQRPKFKQQSQEIQDEYLGFPKIVKELVGYGLELETCGCWLWVSGNTIDYKDKLKELGLRYSPNKKMWYYRPGWYRSSNSTPVDMNFIRQKYGSDSVKKELVFDQPVEANGQGRIQV